VTDPYAVLAAVCISVAIAFPVGVVTGRRQEAREQEERRAWLEWLEKGER